jgi:transposase
MMKTYTQEYKVEAVKLWLENGRRSKEVGEKLGINQTLFLKWHRKLNGEATAPAQRPITQAQGLSTSPSSHLVAENARLRRENERLKMEHEILKKTVAFISGITK